MARLDFHSTFSEKYQIQVDRYIDTIKATPGFKALSVSRNSERHPVNLIHDINVFFLNQPLPGLWHNIINHSEAQLLDSYTPSTFDNDKIL